MLDMLVLPGKFEFGWCIAPTRWPSGTGASASVAGRSPLPGPRVGDGATVVGCTVNNCTDPVFNRTGAPSTGRPSSGTQLHGWAQTKKKVLRRSTGVLSGKEKAALGSSHAGRPDHDLRTEVPGM